MIDFLQEATWSRAGLFFLIANFFIFVMSVMGCWLIGKIYRRKRLFEHNESFHAIELFVAILAVILNSAVSLGGWWLWQNGSITLTDGSVTRAIFDCALMVLTMDLGMYISHRAAHHPVIFSMVHRFHHRHESTNPLSLFVLHPLEVIGFGSLMIAFLMVYPMSVSGLLLYLSLNIMFGTLGHTGVEPLAPVFRKIPLLRYMGTSTFHAEHHEHPGYNFGFYTLIWDKIFNTLDPEYDNRFSQSGSKFVDPEG